MSNKESQMLCKVSMPREGVEMGLLLAFHLFVYQLKYNKNNTIMLYFGPPEENHFYIFLE